jgi:hypothetical protein
VIQRLLALAGPADPPRLSSAAFNQARFGPLGIHQEKPNKGSEARLENGGATVVSHLRAALVRYWCANAEQR